MKKITKKVLCLALTIATVFSAQGCIRREQSGEQVRKDATQLYIGLGTNGLTRWMEGAKKSFEEKYADVSFESGKKGVQVFFNYNEKFSNFDTLPLNYTGYQEKLIITENVAYNRIIPMALDITDVASTPLNQKLDTDELIRDESTSIAGKMLSQYKNYYEYEGKYYALPSQIARSGLVYDVNLFEDNYLYFAAPDAEHYYEYSCKNIYTGKNATYRFVDEGYTDAELSAGPDGARGTYDDGLPATYEEFFALCDYMKKEFGIDPVRWAGKVQSYMMGVVEGLAADYEGNEYLLKTHFDDVASNLVVFNEKGEITFGSDGKPVTRSMDITMKNGYELTAQEGFYYALTFLEKFLASDYYDKDLCFNGTSDHLTTQSKYLLSSKDSKVSSIAMLAEGSWWYGEADNTFKDMAAKYGDEWSSQNRKFAYLPLPKVDESKIGQKESTQAVLNMTSFITKDVKGAQLKAAKYFMREMYSREGILDFVSVTGQMRPYSIDLTDGEYNSLTEFGKSNYRTLKNFNILFTPSFSPAYLANNSILDASYNFHWTSNIGSVAPQVIRSGYTAKEYFEEVHKYWTKEKWDSYYEGIAYQN